MTGEIDLKGFRPQAVTRYLAANGLPKIEDTPLDLHLKYESDGRKVIKTEIGAAIAPLTLLKGQERLVIRSKPIKGTIFRFMSDSFFEHGLY